MSADEKTMVPTLFAFVGVRPLDEYNPAGEYRAVFVAVTQAQVDGTEEIPHDIVERHRSIFSEDMTRKLKFCQPGAVYLFNYNGESIGYAQKQIPTQRLSDEIATKWAAIHRATEKSRKAIASLNVNPRELMYETLAPIRSAYWSMPATTRDQLIADVVTMIVRPRAPKKKEAK